MKTDSSASPKTARIRRRVGRNGLPFLAAQLPPDFRSVGNVNAFIYSLTVETTAGRVKPRLAAILGYLSQLALQTFPYFEREEQLAIARREAEAPPFEFVTHIPPRGHPHHPLTPKEPPAPSQPGQLVVQHPSRT
jgi:hypothetical protein